MKLLKLLVPTPTPHTPIFELSEHPWLCSLFIMGLWASPSHPKLIPGRNASYRNASHSYKSDQNILLSSLSTPSHLCKCWAFLLRINVKSSHIYSWLSYNNPYTNFLLMLRKLLSLWNGILFKNKNSWIHLFGFFLWLMGNSEVCFAGSI